MRKHIPDLFFLPVCVVCVMILFSSCITSKNVVYFNNLPDSVSIALDTLRPPVMIVQTNDIVQINIGGENEKTVQYISQYFTGGEALKVMVDINGDIELPKIGKLHVVGLTKEQVKEMITSAYKEYLVDPIVQVTFGNFHFTVLGEVGHPGSFDMQSEKVNIFEALGMAGDLTSDALKDRLKIIREINGQRQIISLNLLDKNILNSPYYYLHRYDILYAEPKPLKLTSENVQRISPYLGIISSLLAIIVLLTK